MSKEECTQSLSRCLDWLQEIACPNCGGHPVVKAGYSARGERSYRCENPGCPTKSFMLNDRYNAYHLVIKKTVVEWAINSSGICDTAGVLGIAKDHDQHAKKKRLDEQWFFVGKPSRCGL